MRTGPIPVGWIQLGPRVFGMPPWAADLFDMEPWRRAPAANDNKGKLEGVR